MECPCVCQMSSDCIPTGHTSLIRFYFLFHLFASDVVLVLRLIKCGVVSFCGEMVADSKSIIHLNIVYDPLGNCISCSHFVIFISLSEISSNNSKGL